MSTNPAHYQAGPNPDREPPLDPYWQRRLDDVGARLNQRLQWYWMKETRTWGIQQRLANGSWQTVFMHYDDNGAHIGNRYPYKAIDELAFKEFCEACLEIKYDTGDRDKDRQMHDADIAARNAADKVKRDAAGAERIHNVIAGNDPKRFARLLRHEVTHAGPGVRFTEYFPGAALESAPKAE